MNVLTENPSRNYTVEEYLHLEEKSAVKHHFINGKIIALPGATPAHNLIAGNIITQLNNELEKKPKAYFVLTSDSKLYIPRCCSRM